MDKFIKMLEDKIAMIKELIESNQAVLGKTEDAPSVKKLTDEILAKTKELGKAEAQLENMLAQQTAEIEAAKKSGILEPNSGMQNAPSRVKIVGTPGVYKSAFMPNHEFKLRKEIELAKRGNLSPAMRKSFENDETAELVTKFFCDLIAKGQSMAEGGPFALAARKAAMMKAALAEGSDTIGGSLRADEVRTELIAYVRDTSIAMQDCQLIQMNSDVQTHPKELTGVSVGYGAETDSASETESTYVDVTLTARKMHAYSVCSNELIMDTFINGGIISVLLPQFIEAVGQKVDSTVFLSDGTDSAQFSGLFCVGVPGYSQVFGTSSAAFSMLLESDVRGILAKIPERYLRDGGKWYMSQVVMYNNFAGLQDGDKRPLFYQPSGSPGGQIIAGYPVRMPTQTPSTSGASTIMAIIANLKALIIGERMTNVDLFIDPYTSAKKAQTEFILFTRWGYGLALAKMIGGIKTAA